MCGAQRGLSLHLALVAAEGEANLGVQLELWLSGGVENTSGRTARAMGSVTSRLQERNRNVFISEGAQ